MRTSCLSRHSFIHTTRKCKNEGHCQGHTCSTLYVPAMLTTTNVMITMVMTKKIMMMIMVMMEEIEEKKS